MPSGLTRENSSADIDAKINALLGDKNFCSDLLARLQETLDGRQMRFMEVCGTHTVSIFQSGLRSLLPSNIIHLSGPGCPVCVTHESEVDAFLELAREENAILATFGDLIRVPGSKGRTLKKARSEGADIRVVYSPLDALRLAEENPGREVIFPGIGFETTAPLTAAVVRTARDRGLKNFSVLSLHKLVPPALRSLLEDDAANIDAFLLPGHVAAITGPRPFDFIPKNFGKPAVVGGFEAGDILLALLEMAAALKTGSHEALNAYPRAVAEDGNPRAREILNDVFRVDSSRWRGLGTIENSGLKIAEKYADHDAERKFEPRWEDPKPIAGCKCGDILKGVISPSDCPLFGKSCSPASPIGPCMVSTEGSCAAHYKYGAA